MNEVQETAVQASATNNSDAKIRILDHIATLEQALEFIEIKKQEDANKFIKEFTDEGIQVLNGRYGPYVTDGKKNAKIPKDVEPDSLTLEQCQEMIAKAPARKARRKTAKKKKAS